MILVAAIVPAVAADGVPFDALRHLLEQNGFLNVADIRAGRECSSPLVLLMSGMSTERLGPTMLQPYRGYVEYRDGELALGDRISAAALEHQFCLTMTTPTAFAMDVAFLVCNALEHRSALSADLRSSVELALHEALANAIMHGNLGLDSALKNSADQYDAFCDRIQESLKEVESGCRWIDVTADWSEAELEISVVDQGDGYDEAQNSDHADSQAPYGRGMDIIRALAAAVTVSDGGRCTILRFRYDG